VVVREGVQRAEYQSASDRNRAALQAQLLQQGFGQAQGLAQQNIANQLQLGQAQQGFLGQDVGALSTLGGINQAQNQAQTYMLNNNYYKHNHNNR
jgi:hypothetical protein